MSTKLSFKIDDDLLDALGQAAPGEKNQLSLLRAKGGMITGDKMSRLQSTGIVDTTGNVKGDYRQVLDTLSRPRTVSTMRYTAGSRLYEFIVSFPDILSSQPVSILHDNRQLVVEAPAAVEEAFALIDQNIGHSRYASDNFSGRFSVEESFSVFALMDLERSANLRALADGVDFESASFELPAVVEKVVNRKASLQSLEYALQSRLALSTPPTSTQVESGLRKLAARNLVARENNKYRLNDQLSHIAGRLPVIDNFITVDTTRLDQANELYSANFTALQSGVNDILYFEIHNVEVIIRSVTGMQIVGLVAKFLNEPDAIKLSETATPSPAMARPAIAGSMKFCPQCGSPLSPSSRFCPNCGNKASV